MTNTDGTKEKLVLPMENSSDEKLWDYLLSKGIDKEVIDTCIAWQILYESKPYHNIVYIGYDRKMRPEYAEYQSVFREQIHGTVRGSDRRYGFQITCKDSRSLHVFETPLDLLSYATLLKMTGKPWKKRNLLALTGIYRSKNNGRIMMPLALKEFLTGHPEVHDIFLHFEESEKGHEAAIAIEQALGRVKGQDYGVIKVGMSGVKTVNEYLLSMIKQQEKEIQEDGKEWSR